MLPGQPLGGRGKQVVCFRDKTTIYFQLRIYYILHMNKKFIMIAIACLIVGAAVGYYFGYDIGFERAVAQLN